MKSCPPFPSGTVALVASIGSFYFKNDVVQPVFRQQSTATTATTATTAEPAPKVAVPEIVEATVATATAKPTTMLEASHEQCKTIAFLRIQKMPG